MIPKKGSKGSDSFQAAEEENVATKGCFQLTFEQSSFQQFFAGTGFSRTRFFFWIPKMPVSYMYWFWPDSAILLVFEQLYVTDSYEVTNNKWRMSKWQSGSSAETRLQKSHIIVTKKQKKSLSHCAGHRYPNAKSWIELKSCIYWEMAAEENMERLKKAMLRPENKVRGFIRHCMTMNVFESAQARAFTGQ